ncbi:MAG TPA: 6-phosphofructokinase [Saprospiraceae bacterium]|nr:6-phosphofructokinase [Saprospiraceae bacterium]HMW74364.1 6-phosphofructokinase [Saprospiraceae bacterium]HMX82959.1 6-phosphofructokinase [Saprospiraceae bacterium]HMX84729.1 6-phosphofructokinase [Saprospiraceae bacterium]HMZ72526.1 6-phosphofructokinase [Saprospiraceae bacterium]
MKKIAVLTSGGDAPGMNACIRAVVRTGTSSGIEVMGIMRGFQGMIDDEFIVLDSQAVSNIIQTGGTILKSARSEEFRTPQGRKKAFDNLKQHNIDGLVAIGGDGTFRGANAFISEYGFPIVAVPGTIDNDLYGTDFTIGYDTAINTAMSAIDNIKDTANAHNRVFFVEVMGRDSGFIALRSAIATGAEAVIIPETPTDIASLAQQLKDNYDRKKRASIIIVAEGDECGGAFKIAQKVKEHNPEFDTKVTVLGHIQRGGRPTCMDRVLASRLGMEAVRALLNGTSGVMIGQLHKKIAHTPLVKAIKHNVTVNPLLVEMVNILA